MQTLSAQNLFASALSMNSHYNCGFDTIGESSQISARSQSINIRERSTPKIQQQSEAKPRSEQPRLNERVILSQTEVMTSTNKTSQTPRSNSPAVFASESSIAAPAVEVDPEAPEREYFMRCVVLGSENTGKHTLIGSNFDDAGRIAHDKAEANFLARTTKSFKNTKKYNFWVRTLGDNSETKEAIWKTYYKWANAFVFVYDTTNKESFEALKRSVESVLQVVPREKFFGVLVGTKNELHGQRQVSFEDAVDFKLKYNFNHFVETCESIEKESPQILSRLDAKLKLTFESI